MEVLSSRVIYHTADLASLRSFYEETIGLRIYREYGVGGRVTGVVYFLGGGFLELSASSDATSGPLTLWLQVLDVETEEDRLRTAGVDIVKPAAQMPWGLVESWIRDPVGNELRLIEVPADHPLRRRT